MSQKLIIAVLGGIIVLGGGAWFYQTNIAGDSGISQKSTQKQSGDDKEKDGGIFDSIKEGADSFGAAFKVGAAQQCQFSGTDPDSGEYMEGIVYVDGESFVMKADTVVEGEDAVLNMIQHEQVMYIWTDDEAQMPGLKIDVSMFGDLPEEEKPPSILDELKKPDSGFESRCKGWSPKNSSFEPPKDVEFMDMFGAFGAMFSGMMEEGGGMMGGEGMFGGGFGEESYDDSGSNMGSSDDWGY